MLSLFMACAFVESGLNPNAVGDNGKSVGIVQIQKTVVDDVNDFLRKKGSLTCYTYEDRKSVAKSYKIFKLYLERWADGKSLEVKARIWNGGPKGYLKKATKPYWKRVERILLREELAG